MRAQVVEVKDAVGRLLYSPIFHSGGKKLLAKGHQLSADDIRLLGSAGLQEVCVALLDEGEVPEEEAAQRLALAAGAGALEVRPAPGGRANLHAVEPCCLLVNDEALREINRSGVVTMATVPHLSYAAAGQRVATVNTVPFAVPLRGFQQACERVQERGPVIDGRPIRQPSLGVLYSDPQRGERARYLFEAVMRTRLRRVGLDATFVLTTLEQQEAVARSLSHLLRARPRLVLIASTIAPAGPGDVVGRAMAMGGCAIESFLAPVEPGNLLLLAYKGDTAVIAAPGCFRSPRPNVIDLILPPLLAGYRLRASEIAGMGHGGLLQ